jgi:UDP-N-acetylmuramoyl-L-alanyl-D-glutamate--2,6-diaminopimelate ligase
MQWTLKALVGAAGLEADLTADASISGLAYDTRSVRPGDLFCCIPGARADGHAFAEDAVASGAAALLVQRPLEVAVPQAVMPSVRAALGPLAATFFGSPSGDLAVAAVTGTNGKTTVTYLVESIARAAGREPGVVGTVSRRYRGAETKAARNTPEAIDLQRLLREMADAGVDIVALEATSDGLEQGRLRGTRLVTAAFTNLTQDHLNTHGTMEAYFEAKALLFDRAYTDRAVVNVGDVSGRRIADRTRGTLDVLTYGGEDAEIACVDAAIAPTGNRARLRTPDGEVDIAMHLVGRYNIDNAMCAFGIGVHLGIPVTAIVDGIAALSRVPGRLEPVVGGQPFLALVDYAHTPDALEQALRACRDLTTGRVIVVFGCGGDRDRAKRPLMGEIAARLGDIAVVTSDNPRTEDPDRILRDIEVGAKRGGGPFTIVGDRREAIAFALGEAAAGDVVLVAGKGHEQGQEFADHTIPFDDRTVVGELLEEVTCRS